MRYLPLALILLACGSEDECEAPPPGVYLQQVDEISGDCGPIPDRLVRIGDDSDSGDCVRLSESTTDDMCHHEVEDMCDIELDDGTPAVLTSLSVADRTPGTHDASALLDVTIEADGETLCHGVYEATLQKQ